MRMRVPFLALLNGLRICCCHELWCRSQARPGSRDSVAVVRPAATAPIGLLAWELSCAVGVTLKRQKKKKKIWSCIWVLTVSVYYVWPFHYSTGSQILMCLRSAPKSGKERKNQDWEWRWEFGIIWNISFFLTRKLCSCIICVGKNKNLKYNLGCFLNLRTRPGDSN